MSWAVDPGRRSQTRFALGYHLSGFQPFGMSVLSEAAQTFFKSTTQKPKSRTPGVVR